MSNILEFPSREKQAYAYLTDQLGSLLRDKGADDVLIAHATELLTKVYGDLQGESDFSFSVSLPRGMDLDEVQQLPEEIGSGEISCIDCFTSWISFSYATQSCSRTIFLQIQPRTTRVVPQRSYNQIQSGDD